jgi:hypothetical protein
LNALVTENLLHLIRDVGILPTHELATALDDRDAAPEATVRLAQFEADVASAEHDEMRGHVVELERLDIGERPGGLEARNARDRRVRSDVEEHLVSHKYPRPAVVQAHLQRSRRHKTSRPHDQFGAARRVILQMRGNLGVNHVALALAHRRHVDGDGTGHGAELRSVVHQVRDLGAPNLILAGQAVDVGTGAPDIPALHDGSPSPGARHIPSQELATLPTAEDQDLKPLWWSHALLSVRALSSQPLAVRTERAIPILRENGIWTGKRGRMKKTRRMRGRMLAAELCLIPPQCEIAGCHDATTPLRYDRKLWIVEPVTPSAYPPA